MADRFCGPWFVGELVLDVEIVDARLVWLWVDLSRWRLTVGEA